MRKLYPNSRIEIWAADYINNECNRQEEDRNVDIVQIECTVRGSYIVEIVEKAEIKDETPNISELARQVVDGE